MKIAALSRNAGFTRHLRESLSKPPVVADRLPRCDEQLILLLHLSSLSPLERERLPQLASQCRVVALSDRPELAEMLQLVRLGVRGYGNSFMAADNLQQMLRVVEQGQLWLPPRLQQQALELAHRSLSQETQHPPLSLDELTGREAEIARAVAEGLSNRLIAERFGITERTVKAHLSSIYRKLGIKGRMELVVGLHAA